jgi:WD40 repeat protein
VPTVSSNIDSRRTQTCGFRQSLSPDGKVLADGGINSDSSYNLSGILELWNRSNGSLLYSLPTTADDGVLTIAISPDGKTLASGGAKFVTNSSGGNSLAGVLEIWDIPSGHLLNTPRLATGTGSVNAVQFSPDGSVLYIGTDIGISFFNMTNYGRIADYQPDDPSGVTSITLAPTGDRFAITSADGAVEVASILIYPQGMSLTASSVTAGAVVNGTVTLNAPAPAGGITIALASSRSAVTVSPATLTIPAGAGSGSFTLTTSPKLTIDITTAITATSGFSRLTASLAVKAEPITALSLSSGSVSAGGTVTGTLTLAQPAPAGGVVVALSASNTAATVPASVTVAAGATTASFTVAAASSVSSDTQVTIKASENGFSKKVVLEVKK